MDIKSETLLVRKLRRDSFRHHSRGEPYVTNRGIKEYDELLPRFHGETVIAHIGRRPRTDEVSVLDVGCGRGDFLAELFERFPRLKACGLSAYDYRIAIEDSRLRQLVRQIDYRVGDAQKLRATFPDKRYDFITSVQTFMYLGDPLNVLRQCYGLLKPEGIVFIDQPRLALSKEEMEQLKEFWRTYGIEADFESDVDIDARRFYWFDVAIRKSTSDRLPMPFRYRTPTSDNPSIYELNREAINRQPVLC